MKYCTEKEVAEFYCPFTVGNLHPSPCHGSKCLAWEFLPSDRRKRVRVPSLGFIPKGLPDTWASEAVSGSYSDSGESEFYYSEPEEEFQARRKGYCLRLVSNTGPAVSGSL